MLFRKSFLQLAALMLALAVISSACSSSSSTEDQPNASDSDKLESPQAITLKVMNGLFNEKDWQTIVVEPLEKKFPHITLDQGSGVARTYDEQFLEESIAGGNTPDIVLSGIAQSLLMAPLGLAQGLAPLVKKNQLDMNAYDSTVVETIQVYSSLFNMEMVTLPLYINFKVLLYNKDLFDKFAVPYPANHMTHHEIIELSRQLSRTDGGVPYFGYAGDGPIEIASQYSQGLIDRKTNQVNLSGLEKVFSMLKEAMDLPGMRAEGSRGFETDKTMAMATQWLASVVQNADAYNEMNWGMVTYPEFADRPYQTEVDFHSMFITKTTSYPDQAFQVISWMMESEEIQSLITRSGKITVLKNEDITLLWGKDSGLGTEEALEAILETRMAPARDVHPLDRRGTVTAPLYEAYTAYLNGTKDLNVALRDAAEEMQKAVNAELGL